MSTAQHVFLTFGSLLGFIGIAAGAFGAHLFKSKLSQELFDVYEVAVRYQMIHVLALLGLVALMGTVHTGWFTMTGVLFIAGIILFSGSLYALVFSGIRSWGAVTPVGGILLLLGWLSLLVGGFFARSV